MTNSTETTTFIHTDTKQNLAELGLKLPDVTTGTASYVPAIRSGHTVFTSGQLPLAGGALLGTGKVGAEVMAEEAADLAVTCTLNALAAAGQHGDLDTARVLKVIGFVASAPGFNGQPAVMNAASNLLLQVFGNKGQHARSAVGVAELPLNAPVEVELIVEFA
ncbi:RidA family protein [Arthrobacter sp. AB6]|uniref:RidA family protein n=1 Tax=Arthrobacter sp. AB6 TaxID=2962570 RepID=UPI002881396D|nr:RidA family protein [Arthrobacter sp. AB6]MDT0196719.1 RidA family protein [Arthrobacter sp. AB6]